MCVKSIYVLEDLDNTVECGWVWNLSRVDAPVNFAAWQVWGNYDCNYDAGYPTIPRPAVNYSHDYQLEKTSSTSNDWRMRYDGSIMATKLNVIYTGRSIIASERNESADSPLRALLGPEEVLQLHGVELLDEPIPLRPQPRRRQRRVADHDQRPRHRDLPALGRRTTKRCDMRKDDHRRCGAPGARATRVCRKSGRDAPRLRQGDVA